ncbi:MAG TPA: RidA family protein [Xanthobacteraceae bacterium]|nr:RidA family protein [Xanthobacteraceae bacterium]
MPERKLAQLGLSLPSYRGPAANYLPFKLHAGVIYLSGQGPRRPDGSYIIGKVGREFTADEGYEHARLVALGLLSVAKMAAGDLARVEVLKVFGMVNAVPEFGEHPKVINGCSDLLVEVLGERGRHARSAVGMNSLPNGMSVEIEAVMRIVN